MLGRKQRRTHERGRQSRGFSLTELMIVLVILGVLLTVALPGFRNLALATRLTNYANELVASVYLARGEAIKRNTDVRLCASTDGASCATAGGWAQGWIILDPNDVVLKDHGALSDGFSMIESSGAHLLSFDSAGVLGGVSDFKLCRAAPSAGYQERNIAVTALGRTNVTRTNLGVCP